MHSKTRLSSFCPAALLRLFAALALTPAALAVDVSWINPGSSSWFTGANWSGGAFPTSPTGVIIDMGTSQITSGAATSGNITIGATGTGALQISGGSTLTTNGDSFLGTGGSANGTATVTGAGSNWSIDNNMSVGGGSGTGTLMISSGGHVNVGGGLTVGAGVAGTTTVTGAGSSLSASGIILNRGSFTIADAASTQVFASLTVKDATLAVNGTAGSRGVLEVNQLADGGGTGSVSINGGILRANGDQASFTSGFVSGDMTIGAGGAFIDSNSYTIGVTTPLGGTGGLTKQGAGTLTLSAANTYTGGTTISGGTLEIGSQALAVLPGNVVNNGVLKFNESTNSSYGGVISGTGGLIKQGAGTLTLSAVNSYTGGTTISGGTLTIGNGHSPASIPGDVVNNGKLIFNPSSSSFIFDKTISGTGSVGVGGAGLIITGENTYTGGTTLSSGTLQIGAGGTTGSIIGDIVYNGGLLTFNRSDDITFGGAISGYALLTKAGAGTLVLTGANTYGGQTTVSSGTLKAGSASALQANSDYTVNAGTLDLNDFPLSMASLNGIGGGTVDIGSAVLTVNQGAFDGNITGTAGLIKSGTGKLTLTGGNTYTGDTTISAGTLEIGGTVATVLPGNVVNNGALVVNRSSDLTYGGVISGTGGLTKKNTNTLTLAGADTYTGVTTISAGTLQIGAGGSTGSLTGNISNSGMLIFNRSDASSFGGNISGTGSVTKNGAGMLVITGANTYSGGTTLSAGTLQAGAAGALPTNTAYKVDAGTLDLNGFSLTVSSLSGSGGTVNLGSATLTVSQSSNTFYSGSITGTGGLIKIGAATLMLTNGNTYTGGTTISGGTLQIGGGVSSVIVGDVVNNGIFAFNRTSDYTFGGVVSGTGALSKLNTGMLTLTGANTYTGTTTVSAGTLRLAGGGSLASSVNVASGATLGGDGAIAGSTTISGTLAPGSGAGLLTFANNLVLNPGSTTSIQLGGGTISLFDQVSVDLALTYGGTLGIAFINGFAPQIGDTFQLFKDFNSESGAFTSIAFADPAYTGNFDYSTGTLNIASVPEPSPLALGIAGLLVLGGAVRRARKSAGR